MEQDDKQIDFTSKIKDRIKEGKVKMRSRWFFIVEKIGLEGILSISIVLSIACFALVLHIMQQNGAFEFVEFGFSGMGVIWKNIPFDILVAGIVFMITANFIIKQFDVSYRKPFYLFSCSILFIISILGFLSYWTGVTHAVFNEDSGILSGIYHNKITHQPGTDYAIIGKVVDSRFNYLAIQTPQNQVVVVAVNSQSLPAKGQIVKLVGTKTGNQFKAEKVSIVKTNPTRYFKITIKSTPTSTPVPVATNTN